MNWVLKAIVQKTISFLPYSIKINYLFQRFVTIGKELPYEFVKSRINLAQEHLSFYQKYGRVPIDKIQITEIGTGWYPIVPIYLYLKGVNHITTVDIKQLYTNNSVDKTFRAVLNFIKTNEKEKSFTSLTNERVENIKLAISEKNVKKKFSMFNTIGLIETNCLKNIESSTQDFIISNNTFQYIPECDLPFIFSEMKRISKQGAIISNFIDFTDHFSQSDHNLSPYHFLRYSDSKWRLITSRLQLQNRLRQPYFRKQFEKENIVILEEKINLGSEEALIKMRINRKFSQYSLNEIGITHCHFIAKNIQ